MLNKSNRPLSLPFTPFTLQNKIHAVGIPSSANDWLGGISDIPHPQLNSKHSIFWN